jgi:hypothetical protein
VSYGIDWRSGARQAFGRLDLDAQEVVLDQVEAFAASADLLPNRPLPLTLDHETRVETSVAAYDVFLRVEYVPRQRTMVVVRLGFHSQPKQP